MLKVIENLAEDHRRFGKWRLIFAASKPMETILSGLNSLISARFSGEILGSPSRFTVLNLLALTPPRLTIWVAIVWYAGMSSLKNRTTLFGSISGLGVGGGASFDTGGGSSGAVG